MTRCTVWPLMSMPRICSPAAAASSADFATFTPPALPRPPVFTCALTTTTPPLFGPISSAAARTASGVSATTPASTGTPCASNMSRAWYSKRSTPAVPSLECPIRARGSLSAGRWAADGPRGRCDRCHPHTPGMRVSRPRRPVRRAPAAPTPARRPWGWAGRLAASRVAGRRAEVRPGPLAAPELAVTEHRHRTVADHLDDGGLGAVDVAVLAEPGGDLLERPRWRRRPAPHRRPRRAGRRW